MVQFDVREVQGDCIIVVYLRVYEEVRSQRDRGCKRSFSMNDGMFAEDDGLSGRGDYERIRDACAALAKVWKDDGISSNRVLGSGIWTEVDGEQQTIKCFPMSKFWPSCSRGADARRRGTWHVILSVHRTRHLDLA